jgi:ethanolamine utilization protein EutQ (cupin superfamily)
VITEGKVRRLRESDVEWDELVPGIQLARSITAAGTTQLGGGYMRFSADAEFAGWTLKYDEVLFVQQGRLEILEDGRSTVAQAGEAVLIPNGATVTYKGRKDTIGFFVLWPFDWNRQA